MPCYSPVEGYRAKAVNPKTGKRSIVFSQRDALDDGVVKIACGQCIGCRLERSRQWAIRCVHEASLHSRNCFITLTYNNKHLPKDGSLKLHHFQNFMKRLRKKHGEGIRFFHCGEYGEKFSRPHYHAILFNFDFADRVLHSPNRGFPLYTSDDLNSLWSSNGEPMGFATIGDVTFESAAYVARYITKKITGPMAESHYEAMSLQTGELYQRKPEYTTMSRRPGIGRGWYESFARDVYPDDFVLMKRDDKMVKIKPPKYYDALFDIDFPLEMENIKHTRKERAAKHFQNCTYERLRVREECQLRKFQLLKRGYENDL